MSRSRPAPREPDGSETSQRTCPRMLRIRRQLTPEEMRVVAVQCGARAGAAPEEIIRCLSRLCGVFVWGIFPAGSEEVLLDHVGRRLGMTPLPSAAPRALAQRERGIFGCYV